MLHLITDIVQNIYLWGMSFKTSSAGGAYMKINWKVRAKNKTFWLTLIPAVLLIVQLVTGWFGISFPIEKVSAEAIILVNAIFSVLVILGIVIDPTVEGVNDSHEVLKYDKPACGKEQDKQE